MQSDSQSGIWLLSVYAMLVVASVGAAIGLMFGLDKVMPAHAGWIFIVAMGTALVAPWPAAVWLTTPALAKRL